MDAYEHSIPSPCPKPSVNSIVLFNISKNQKRARLSLSSCELFQAFGYLLIIKAIVYLNSVLKKLS